MKVGFVLGLICLVSLQIKAQESSSDPLDEILVLVKEIKDRQESLENKIENLEATLLNEVKELKDLVACAAGNGSNEEVKDEDMIAEINYDCVKGMPEYSSADPYPYPLVNVSLDGVQEQLLCDTKTDGGGWLLIHRRVFGNVAFDRDWNAYKTGFGTFETDFWLGLDTIHALTSSGVYELRVDLVYREDERRVFATYNPFNVASEAENYRLDLGSFDGSDKDGFNYQGTNYHLNGMAFSTKDRDNDNQPYMSCAENGGFWLNACTMTNLNSYWGMNTFNWGVTPLQSAEMKIRKVADKA